MSQKASERAPLLAPVVDKYDHSTDATAPSPYTVVTRHCLDTKNATSLDRHELKWTKKIAFAFGSPPIVIMNTLAGFQFNAFLLQYLKPRLIGGIVLAGRVCDAVTDPLIGVMTTRTRSRWGSLKPWLIGGILPLAFSNICMWSVPPWYSYSLRAFFAAISYLLFQFSTAIYQVPYMALTMHLSHVPAEVESATAWRAVAESLSNMVAAGATKLILPFTKLSAGCLSAGTPCAGYDPEHMAYILQAIVVGVLCVLCGLVVGCNIFEQRHPHSGEIVAPPRDNITYGFYKVFSLRIYRMLILACLWTWMAVAVLQNNFVIYCQIVLRITFDEASSLLVVLLSCAVAAIPLWYRLAMFLGKKRTFMVGLILLIPFHITFYFLDEKAASWFLSLLVAGYGFPLSAVYLLPGIMLPNVINDATIRDDGARREALFYSYFVLFQKMGSGVAIYATNEILQSFGGYDSDKDIDANVGATDTLRFLMGFFPILFIISSIGFLTQYTLTDAVEKENKMKLDILREQAEVQH